MADPVLLHVEDEDAAVFLLEMSLKEANIEVELYRVSDGEQALSFLSRLGLYEKAPRPDLVLLDLNLPRRSGLEVLAEMKGTETLRPIPVVVFTSSSASTDRERSLALGAREYITKPATLDGFIGAVKAACSYLPARSSNSSPDNG